MLLSHCDAYVTHLLARSRDRDVLLLPLFVLDGIRLPFLTVPMKSDCLSLSHTHTYTHIHQLYKISARITISTTRLILLKDGKIRTGSTRVTNRSDNTHFAWPSSNHGLRQLVATCPDCRQPPLSPMVETTTTTTTTINEQGTRSSSLISPRISRVTTDRLHSLPVRGICPDEIRVMVYEALVVVVVGKVFYTPDD